MKKKIKIPTYSLSEELINSISHGIGAGLSIAALVLCILKSHNALEVTCSSIYGAFMILLYVISCIYHALSPKLLGKGVLRVIDHCNVLLMVAGTYTPLALIGVGGALGWTLFGITWGITLFAIVLTAIDVDKYQYPEVACNLLVGWSTLVAVPSLIKHCGTFSVVFLVLGGVMYSVGAILYKKGAHKKYMHSIFHFFVLAGSLCHFILIYSYILK